MAEYREKIYSRVKPEFDVELRRMAKEYAMSKSAMIALCAKIGLNYLKAMTDPDLIVSPELLADVLVEAEKKGVEFKVPDELQEK